MTKGCSGLRAAGVKRGKDRMFYVNAIGVHPDSPLAKRYG